MTKREKKATAAKHPKARSMAKLRVCYARQDVYHAIELLTQLKEPADHEREALRILRRVWPRVDAAGQCYFKAWDLEARRARRRAASGRAQGETT